MIGIYKIENKLTKEVYIGQSRNIKRRWLQHKNNYLARAKIRKYPLYRDMRRYGIDNFSFEIIEECNEFMLDERERYWIDYYKQKGYCYNIQGVRR